MVSAADSSSKYLDSMLKWLLLVVLVGVVSAHPGVYDEYSYDEEKEGGEDGDYYLYYDEDEEEEPDIDDEELKKITDMIANMSDEDDKPQSAGNGGKKGQKKRPGKNKQRLRRSTSQDQNEAVDMTNRKALWKHREAAKSKSKRSLLDNLISVSDTLLEKLLSHHARPLTKEQREETEGGAVGWQYEMQTPDACSCKQENVCSCCPPSGIMGAGCLNFVAGPNKVDVSITTKTGGQMQVSLAPNSNSNSCSSVNGENLCIHSDGFTTNPEGYKACLIITSNVHEPKAGVLKCINYSNGKSTLTDN